MANENKIKHLEFIQLTITRMNVNSFLVKGWIITLVSALFVLAQQNSNHTFLWLAPFASILFWSLDAYFLSMERKFRALYDDVRALHDSEVDFSMKTTDYEGGRYSWFICGLSLTLLFFYPLILVASIIASAFLNK